MSVARDLSDSTPLPEASLALGFRAIASELSRAERRSSVEALAERLERGESLDAALREVGPLPAPLATLVSLSIRRAQVAPLLAEFVEQCREQAQLRRELRLAFWYPLTLLLLAFVATILIPSHAAGVLGNFAREMDVPVPQSVQVLAWVADWGLAMFGVLAVITLVTLVTLRVALGRGRFRALFHSTPLAGSIWRWLAMARWARSLRLLLVGELPLPAALDASAEELTDEVLVETLRHASQVVAAGGRLSDVLDDYGDWPATLVEFVRWGESRQSLPEALLGGAEICEERARHRGLWFRLAFPTIIFLLIANCVVYSYIALLRPIVELIAKLA